MDTEELKSQIRQMEENLNQIKIMLEMNETPVVERRKEKVLKELYEHEDVVTNNEWREIGKKHGYDSRGLGAFFRGNNSLCFMGPGGKVMLSPRGYKLAEEYIRMLEKTGEKE